MINVCDLAKDPHACRGFEEAQRGGTLPIHICIGVHAYLDAVYIHVYVYMCMYTMYSYIYKYISYILYK